VTPIADVVADNVELLPTPGAQCFSSRAKLLLRKGRLLRLIPNLNLPFDVDFRSHWDNWESQSDRCASLSKRSGASSDPRSLAFAYQTRAVSMLEARPDSLKVASTIGS
jgi:hypothetical protein